MEKPCVDEWLRCSKRSIKILNDILKLVHPDLYDSGKKALARLGDDELTSAASKKWKSVFTGISIIANRRTQLHVDHFGSHKWFDMIVNLGTCTNAWFEFPELGLRLKYNPGAVVLFSGNLFTHGVNEWGDGDRLCYAMFMRQEVLSRFGLEDVGWSTLERCGGEFTEGDLEDQESSSS